MEPTTDAQTLRIIISILRQKLADQEWENTQLQAEIIRLTGNQPSPSPEGPTS